MSRSLMSDYRECFICRTIYNLHKHHIFEGVGRRKISEREGCWVYLCAFHHNLSRYSVHYNKELDNTLKQICQRRWMDENGATENDFRKTFHCGSYL